MYTSIPTELGLEAIEYWIMRKRNLIPQLFTKEFILESIEFMLKNNNFLFDFKMFKSDLWNSHGYKLSNIKRSDCESSAHPQLFNFHSFCKN